MTRVQMTKTISLNVRNYSRTLSDDQVLKAARSAIRDGLPPEAKQYKDWAVEVDGELVGVKWLLSYVTGIPRREFQSQYARNVLGDRLGLTVANSKNPRRAHAPQKRQRASSGNTQHWMEIASNQVADIRKLLSGQSQHRPTDEQLCDWVQFCYLFELYVEGRDLFAQVNPADVNPWQLERTKKLARICSLKAQAHG